MARSVGSFDCFVVANGDGLLRTAYLITGDEGEAEDLVQECLLAIARRWPRVRVMEQPLAYARRVLINLAVRGSKQRSRRYAELETEVVETGADVTAFDALGTREELRDALRELTPRQRAVLVLRYFHDLSEEHSAELLGCTAGTVKSTASRSLAQLRDRLVAAPLHTRSEQR